jgi:hypothetical protein
LKSQAGKLQTHSKVDHFCLYCGALVRAGKRCPNCQ